MKKVFLILTFTMLMFSANTSFAGENGTALTKVEKTINLLIYSLNKGQGTTTYNEIAQGFSPTLKETVTADQLVLVQDQVAEHFGKLKEAKMVSFERFDQGDRAIYIGSFSKESVVSLSFVFNKDGQMTDFSFSPLKVEKEK